MQVKLLEVAEQYNYSWKDIAKLSYFKGKTDNNIWRKYRVLLSTKSEEEIRKTIKRDGNRKLADKVILFKQIQEDRRKNKNTKNSKNSNIKYCEEEHKEEVEDFLNWSLQSQSLPCIHPSSDF
jgi:hypothetical protein